MNQFYKIKRHQRPSRLMLISVFLLVSCLSQVKSTDRIEPSPRDETSVSPDRDKSHQPPYLLIFRAYPPHEKKERNLYDLAQDIKGFVDDSRFPPAGIVTDETVRYGVSVVMQAKVLRATNSAQSPSSSKDGVYLLTYDRTYQICAKNYVINPRTKITYTDYQDGRKYEFPVKKSGTLVITELEIRGENILRELWEAKRKGQ